MATSPSPRSVAALVGRYVRLRELARGVKDVPQDDLRACLAGAAEELLGAGGSEWLTNAVEGKAAVFDGVDTLQGWTLAYLEELWAKRSGWGPRTTEDPARRWLGCHPAIRGLRARLGQLGEPGCPLLVLGERGAGKGHLVRVVHASRGGNPENFFPVSPAAVADGLIESHLFGHEKGAYTGAERQREGYFLAAHQSDGTLFFDDIGEFPPVVQTKLLHVLEEGTYFPVGSDRPRSIGQRGLRRIKVCAASQREGLRSVRPDLLDRLSTLLVRLPPLRERGLDVLLFADGELDRLAKRGVGGMRLSRGACQRLLEYHWPGNVRQLQNVLRRAVEGAALAKGEVLKGADLERAMREERMLREIRDAAPTGAIDPWTGPDGRFRTVEEMRRLHIGEALKRTDGNVTQAAQLLGIPRTTLQHRMKRLEMERQA